MTMQYLDASVVEVRQSTGWLENMDTELLQRNVTDEGTGGKFKEDQDI